MPQENPELDSISYNIERLSDGARCEIVQPESTQEPFLILIGNASYYGNEIPQLISLLQKLYVQIGEPK